MGTCHIISNPSATRLMGIRPFYRQDTKGPTENHVAKATKHWVSAGSPRWQGRTFQAKGTAWPQLGRPRVEYMQGATGCASPPAQHSLCPFQGQAGWDKRWGVLKCRKLSRQVSKARSPKRPGILAGNRTVASFSPPTP